MLRKRSQKPELSKWIARLLVGVMLLGAVLSLNACESLKIEQEKGAVKAPLYTAEMYECVYSLYNNMNLGQIPFHDLMKEHGVDAATRHLFGEVMQGAVMVTPRQQECFNKMLSDWIVWAEAAQSSASGKGGS